MLFELTIYENLVLNIFSYLVVDLDDRAKNCYLIIKPSEVNENQSMSITIRSWEISISSMFNFSFSMNHLKYPFTYRITRELIQ